MFFQCCVAVVSNRVVRWMEKFKSRYSSLPGRLSCCLACPAPRFPVFPATWLPIYHLAWAVLTEIVTERFFFFFKNTYIVLGFFSENEIIINKFNPTANVAYLYFHSNSGWNKLIFENLVFFQWVKCPFASLLFVLISFIDNWKSSNCTIWSHILRN